MLSLNIRIVCFCSRLFPVEGDHLSCILYTHFLSEKLFIPQYLQKSLKGTCLERNACTRIRAMRKKNNVGKVEMSKDKGPQETRENKTILRQAALLYLSIVDVSK